jgi:hypothetical protein
MKGKKKVSTKKQTKNKVSKGFVTSNKNQPKGVGFSVSNTMKRPQLGFGFTKKPGLN